MLLGNKRLERERKVNRAAAKLKQAADEVVDQGKSTIKRRPAK